MAKSFKGRIELHIRDSTPDWGAVLADNHLNGYASISEASTGSGKR